jgi:hypothetical protein
MATLRSKYKVETRLKAEVAQSTSPRCSDNWVMKQEASDKQSLHL